MIGAIGMVFSIYAGHFMWIDLMYYLSYVKLAISLVKYVPQVTYYTIFFKQVS